MNAKNNPKTAGAVAQPNATRAAQVAAEKAAKTPKAPKVAKVDPILAKKVHVVAEKNPKREKSASFGRFGVYKEGMTVLAYIEACVAAKYDRRDARADIGWDTKHKYIELRD